MFRIVGGPIALCLIALVACATGPEPVESGVYRLLAPSGGAGSSTTLVLEIEPGARTLRWIEDGDTTTAQLGPPGPEALTCPPSGRGRPRPLDRPRAVGGIRFTRPALFGNCGATRPRRVTLVDLDSQREGTLPPWSRWAEFCDVRDPDCSA